MLKKILVLLISFLFANHLVAQELNKNRKRIKTTRITTPPKIDGVLSDDAWKNAEICKDFVTLRPDNGKPVAKEYQTEVKVVYDDTAIYISAMMLDPDPKGIPMEFATRDNFSQADFFLVTINPNDDGQNPFEFVVQSTGNQGDAKVSNGNEDFDWSAVWESAAKITEKGWNVEMKIPYRAIRFANRPVQNWGFNFHRRLEKLNEQHTWTHIDNAVGRWTQYDGLIEDFRDIKPPTRLNLYPYASATTTTFEGTTDFDWSVGMDLKYGLTENFTLDATLIPDFSQVGFDDVVLNLGPFEQQFTEQRQFFTEGTELFNKGAKLVELANEKAQPLSVVLFDIDNFKQINDDFGHHIGDLVLKKIAGLVSETMRSRDVFARLGGEEFVAILPNTDMDKAKAIAVRVIEKITQHAFDQEGVNYQLTISIGVANLQETKAVFDDIIHAADLAMYQAKAQGQNQMVSYETISDVQERRQR